MSATEADVVSEIQRILHETLEAPVSVSPTTSVENLDSLTATTVLVSLEDRFRVRLDDLDRGRVRTVADLAREIISRTEGYRDCL